MNPYKEDGPCARLSFDRAYCKRCTAPPSVNDGYITGTERRTGAADGRKPAGCPRVRQRAATPGRLPSGPRPRMGEAPRNAIGTIETLVRQRSNGAFIMRV
ncbi:hypothetical protein J4G52_15655 [Burkholderia cenocepacia]|uniref:hypothetical protein n=1 Tax=Burkholderia cenocepacia TaxID=95486 RepID=UPI001AA16E8E|nr:hypothetical protein [Burkholderia cenocepacia]MBO1854969.1 hypothetical protein [Burkholderia cenocepacia]MDR5642618.1 hypothetical protein [Burkholderia cenocepacia]